jgi:hypothetical protein
MKEEGGRVGHVENQQRRWEGSVEMGEQVAGQSGYRIMSTERALTK